MLSIIIFMSAITIPISSFAIGKQLMHYLTKWMEDYKRRKQMKLKDITNSKCDVRKYMKVGMSDEEIETLADWHEIDISVVQDIVKTCSIYVKNEYADEVIEPFDLNKFLEE